MPTALRIETTINSPKEYKVFRTKEGEPKDAAKSWQHLRKGVADMPRRAEIHLRLRRDGHQLEPFLRALPKLSLRMRHEHRPVAEGAKTEDSEQHLVLSAAPRPRCVEVNGKHQAVGIRVPPRSRSHNFASFRNT